MRDIIDNNYQLAEKLLKENQDKLHVMAKALIKYETLDAEQIKMIMAGKEPGEPKTWKDDPDFDDKNTKETQSKSNKGESKGSMDSNDNLNNPIKEH